VAMEERFLDAIKAASLEFNLPWQLGAAIALTENSFSANQREGMDGEIGFMQVRPIAMQDTSVFATVNSSLLDKARAGIAYIAWLHNQNRDPYWIFAAYNAGPTGAARGHGASYASRALAHYYSLGGSEIV